MKKKIFSLILACVMLLSSFAIFASAADYITVEDFKKKAEGWILPAVLTLDSAKDTVAPAKVYLKSNATELSVLVEAPQNTATKVQNAWLLINFAPAECEGKGKDNSKGNYLEVKINATDGTAEHIYASENGAYTDGDELVAVPANSTVRKNDDTVWTLEYKIALPASVKSILKKKSHDIEIDAYVRYAKDGQEVNAYSLTNNPTAFGWDGENAVVYSIADNATKEIGDTMAWIANDRSRFYDESLQGLTVNLIGDSYLAGHTMKDPDIFMWHSLLAEKYGWNVTNLAKNSASVSPLNKKDTQPDPLTVVCENLPDNDPDLVIFNGGKNDYNNMVPIGSDFSTDNLNTDTFVGALNVVIDALQEKYPEATIIYSAVWNFTGSYKVLDADGNETDTKITYSDYALSAQMVCDNQGICFFEAHDPLVSGVDMEDAEFRTKYCMSSTDVSHLNAEGMKLVMPKYEDFIYRSINGIVDLPPVIEDDDPVTVTTPETTEPETEEATKAVSDTTAETGEATKKKGCKSSVAAPVIILTAVFGLALAIRRKKHGARS